MATPRGEEIYASYDGRRLTDWRYLGVARFTGGSGTLSEVSGSLQVIAMVDPATNHVSVRGWGWMVF